MAQCKRHSNVETNLRCGKCEDYICPKCMVETPVGARCPSCAGLNKLPTYQFSGKHYLRGGLVALGLALAVGYLWLLILVFVPYVGFINIFLAAGVGYAIGEGISWAANRRRGTVLAVMGGISLAGAWLITNPGIWAGVFNPFSLLALLVGGFVAVNRLR
jgi:hypothetical protein